MQTFSTTWKQCFTAGKYIWMDNCVQEELRKCHWWRSMRTSLHINCRGRHWTNPCHYCGYSTDEVVHHLRISHGWAHGIIHDRLRFHKVCVRQFTKQLTAEHRHNCLTVFQGRSNHFRKRRWRFFETDYHWERDMDPPLHSRKQTPECGM
jgi:hypothetical protein